MRTARASAGNICYHVINRGNGRGEVFHKDSDYLRFTEMMRESCERLAMRVTGWCLMPNHFHLVLWPYEDGDLSRWMQWLMTCHVRRYHRHYNSSGHVWQGRFKAFPIQQDRHFLKVLRYVESNALRAGLVGAAEDWLWCSLNGRQVEPGRGLLSAGPVDRPQDWLRLVNTMPDKEELDAVRHCLKRGCPFGEEDWRMEVAKSLNLESSMNPRDRPRKNEAEK